TSWWSATPCTTCAPPRRATRCAWPSPPAATPAPRSRPAAPTRSSIRSTSWCRGTSAPSRAPSLEAARSRAGGALRRPSQGRRRREPHRVVLDHLAALVGHAQRVRPAAEPRVLDEVVVVEARDRDPRVRLVLGLDLRDRIAMVADLD